MRRQSKSTCSFANIFQSTHPLRGATIQKAEADRAAGISIHAPLAGCDPATPMFSAPAWDFNPRTPCGVRRAKYAVVPSSPKFQSTHPLRGATEADEDEVLDLRISIHAPLAGCDSGRGYLILRRGRFQSTHPLRGATEGEAPPEEVQRDFNPRTPCGVRQSFFDYFLEKFTFQSTHPLRGATVYPSLPHNTKRISIHAPLAGCDKNRSHYPQLQSRFQSTHPLRGATKRKYLLHGR